MQPPLNTPLTENRHHRRRTATAQRGNAGTKAAEAAERFSRELDRFIRERECQQLTGLSRSTRWRLERAGRFPRRRRISAGATGWLASEIAAWLAGRAIV
jgi:prophage regulatory protein